MPEFHPAHTRNFRTDASRIILGSFPTHRFTRKSEAEKVSKAPRSSHFYGGERNLFWLWYIEFIDPFLAKKDFLGREQSLKANGIAITDVIYSCERREYSASDNDLKNRTYQLDFIDFSQQNVVKLLCTSKGVMNEMFFGREFATHYPNFHENNSASISLQNRFSKTTVGNPLARVFEDAAGRRIEAVALPSPGSPFRSLKAFGFVRGDAKLYLNKYLEEVFQWFTE